jgi:hypothetical protein
MCPIRRPKLRLELLLLANLIASTALSSGCGPDGAGTIHIESPQSRRQTIQTGAGLTPSGAMKPGSSATPGKSLARPAIKNGVGKKR